MKTIYKARGAIFVALVTVSCTGVISTGDPATDGQWSPGAGSSPGAGPGGGTITSTSPECVNAGVADPGPAYSRRLTRTDYDNTVRELVGDTSSPARDFPSEVLTFGAGTDYFGFDNDPSLQSVPEVLAEGYFNAAERMAATAVQNLAALVPCAQSADRACGEQFLRSFGERALRRPLDTADVTRYMAPFDVGMTTDFQSGIRLMVTALLESAPFLYRIELGGAPQGVYVKPTSWEMASRLSYFLWKNMPDAALFDAARADQLQTPEQIGAQAKRMLGDDRARGMVADFHRQWLGLRGVPNVQKDGSLFPNFNEVVAADMVTEADRFVQDVIFDGSGKAGDLFNAATTFVNAGLAGFYGLPSISASGFQKVTLDPARRAGLLTLGGPMALLAKHNQTSPVLRGKYVREQILCEHVAPPPPGVNIEVPRLDPNLSTRERFAQHRLDPSCGGCHSLMDPIGLGLENYDPIGRWRDQENGETLDVSGNIVAFSDTGLTGAFVGPAALGSMLAASDQVKACMAKNWFRYAQGRSESDSDVCELAGLSERFKSAGYSVKELLVLMTQTSAFLYRRPIAGGSQ